MWCAFNNSLPPEDPNHLEIENHGFQPLPSETEPEEKPKTWADRRNQVKTYFVKRCKYLWKHRVGVAIIVCLLALCLFPVWIAYTYVLEDQTYRKRSFSYEEYVELNNPNYSVTCRGPKITNDFRLRIAMLSVYGVIFVVGTFGNSLVIYVVLNNPRMRTVTNMFITNLAVSDLLVSSTSLWLTPLYIYTGYWIWGGWLCYGFPLFQGTSIFISTLTLMSIALDRYFVICHHSLVNANINDHMTMPVCVALITLIWTVSLSLVMPYAVHMRLAYVHKPCHYFMCIEDWSQAGLKSVYGVVVLALQFILPFAIIFLSYRNIWSFLNKRFKMVAVERGKDKKKDNKKRKRLLRMLITMVFVFGFCWFPVNALNVFRDFYGVIPMRPYFNYAFLTAHMVSMMATAFNPILYAWMNESFREQFIRTVPQLRWILSKNRRAATRQRVITDCAPATNRVNCGDRVNGRQKLNRPLDTKNKTLLTTTNIPDFADPVSTEDIGEAYELRTMEPSSSQCNQNNENHQISNFLQIPNGDGAPGSSKMRNASNSDISSNLDESRSLLSDFSNYDEF
uniref:G-protein coupled receptors family 1 profile domain-containing protein n=2 Tax=Panagrolaimus sp. PS1159 TaxID=55785 RepID=A0AC35GCF5_9BILA